MERLDKIIAQHCNLSRKEAKVQIRAGRVRVNGAIALSGDIQIDPDMNSVQVDGRVLSLRRCVYLMLNKPRGVLSAARDGRSATVVDLVPAQWRRKDLFPAGRLDKDTTGLLILTDDGDFAHRMLSPQKQVYKTYHARLRDPLTSPQIARLERGVVLQDGTVCLPAAVRLLLEEDPKETTAEIRICEGKYHQIKRMAAACGNAVEALRRVQIGGLCLDESLPEGACRLLTEEDINSIFDS